MEDKNILVKNLDLHYTISGQFTPENHKKTVVILHGWGSNTERWQKVAELLESHLQVIIPDLPGFGKSQAPEAAWTLDNYVEWLLEFSEKVPELTQGFILLGHSFGGALAVKFALKYTQKVEQLFLVSAACVRKRTEGKKFYRRLSRAMKVFSFLPFYQFIRKVFYKFILRKSDYVYQQGIIKETYLKIISDDLSHKLVFVKVPTVIIWGDKDTSTPIAEAHFIQEKIPHSKLIVIPGGEHALNIKMPEVVSEKIITNLSR